MKKYALCLCLLCFGCATYPMSGYNFKMAKPSSDAPLSYADDKIDIKFSVEPMPVKIRAIYNEVGFKLVNKSDKPLTIDWNKISFRDYNGHSGKPVMHEGVKYAECSSSKIPTTIQPRETIVDAILPCYALTFMGQYGWRQEMFPSPPTLPEVNIGFFLPLQFGDQAVNYDFQFSGQLCTINEKDAPCIVSK